MAKPKNRRKTLIFSLIGVALILLTAGAILKKREPIITIQAEKVAKRTLTELVVANGKIQPVLQVKISPEVSGEIIELPVKEGQSVKKGDLIMKIKPDFYIANRNQADAAYQSSRAAITTAEANLAKAKAEFTRNQELFDRKLISDSVFIEFKTGFDIAEAQLISAKHQTEMTKAQLASADEALSKTTIVSPLDGTVSKLNSQLGERVVGTATMAGTEVMTISDLNEMEARVDIGEIDVVLIAPGQHARLEVDAYKDRKFNGTVTEIANSAKSSLPGGSSGNNQEATKFEVKIRVTEKEVFRPGMSVTAEIETRSHTNVLSVPIASVTTRLPKDKNKKDGKDKAGSKTNEVVAAATNATPAASANKKAKEAPKPVEVVFVVDGERAKMIPVKIGISDDSYWEITEGLQENQEVVSGGYRAISRDLEDGKKIKKGTLGKEVAKEDVKPGE
jgi:HlyD family secretion protein